MNRMARLVRMQKPSSPKGPGMLTRTDIDALMADTTAPALSLFLPTHVAGREIRQDPIRLRKLLGTARDRLIEQGLRSSDSDSLLKPGQDLVDDGLFWRHQAEGLALFLDSRSQHVLKLPMAVQEEVHVDDRFHIRPLLPALTADGRFLVLTVTAKQARLYEGSRYGLRELDLAELPRGTETLFTPQDRLGEPGMRAEDRTVQKPATANAGDAPAYASTPQGLVTNDEVMQYIRQLAGSLDQHLGGTGLPLVLAADERVAGHYLQVNRYPDLVMPPIWLQPDSLSLEALHQHAYALVKPRFDQERLDALDRFRMLSGDGSDLASADPDGVVTAAVNGRVDQLFLRDGATCWGRFLGEANRTVTHHTHQQGDRELLEFAAGHVLRRDGRVYSLPADQMPVEAPACATLRY